MKKSESKTGRHGRLLGLALAAVLVGTPTLGWAQTIDVSGSNGADGSKADLAAAISDINAVDNSANDVIIDLTGTHNDPGATTGQPRWYIYGSGAGLQSVTLNGQAAGGDRAVLDGQQNTGAGVLLGLENAESATLKNLIIKNGYSTTP